MPPVVNSIYDISDKAKMEFKSWLEPFFKTRGDRKGSGGSGGITEITTDGSIVVTDPTGPSVALSALAGTFKRTIEVVIDGGGILLTTGIKTDIEIGFAATISAWTLLADQSGSVVVNIWKDVYANYPPTVADKITASAPPTISSATNAKSSTLTGWTTSISAGDTLRFNIDSVTSIQRVTLALEIIG